MNVLWVLTLALAQTPNPYICLPVERVGPAEPIRRTLVEVEPLVKNGVTIRRCCLEECDQAGSCWCPRVLPDGRKNPLTGEQCQGAIRRDEGAEKRAPELEAARRNRPPRQNEVRLRSDVKNDFAPPEPCTFRRVSGAGIYRGKADWLQCLYFCGNYEVVLYDVWGSTEDDCKRDAHLIRARREAENFVSVQKKKKERAQ